MIAFGRRWLLVVGVLLWSAAAAPDSTVLADDPRWRALLHVNPGATLRGIGSSYVDDDDFFLAERGTQDPSAELRASIAALSQPGSPARCRFPARYRFLSERLGWQDPNPLAHCEDYLEWRARMPIGRLVLVFPAAYLNSPSSMFGHTLLRLDASETPDSVWLSKAINFGAQAGDADNSLFYVWRGLAGGYPGQFSVTAYAEKIRDYAFVENRDMWEYSLDLDADEIDWVVRHLWELRDINFDYFFFDENCSYRLLELIKIARPQAPLAERLRFAELPVDTVRALYAADLIADRRYRPSKADELLLRVERLSETELGLAQALLVDPAAADSPAFMALAPVRRHAVAETAYRALRLRLRKSQREDGAARHSLALLRIVQRYPAPEPLAMPEPAPPENGHGTEMLALGAGRRAGRDQLSFDYRLTYHDLFDPLAGYLPGAAIEGFDIRLSLDEVDGLALDALDLVHIRSLAPRGVFVQPVSWFVHAGLDRQPTRDTDRALTGFIEGGPGASWRIDTVQPYVFSVLRAESASGADPDIASGAGGEIGWIDQREFVQWGAHARYVAFASGFSRFATGATLNVPLSVKRALRFQCSRDRSRGRTVDGCRLSFRQFFD